MARNILAELSVILRDGVSGKAKEVVNSLGKVQKAADDLGKSGKGAGGLNQTAEALNKINKAAIDLAKSGGRLNDWGAAFERRVIKLGAGAADIERLKSAWQRLNAELNKVGSKGAMRTDALRAWRQEALADLLRVRAGAEQTTRALNGLGRNVGGLRAYNRELSVMSNLTRTLGFGGAAYAGQTMIRGGAKAAAEYHRETRARQPFAGISPMDSTALQTRAMSLSGQYRSVGATEINELGRSLYNMTGDMPKALALLEDFTKAFVVLQTSKGVEGATKELEDFLKALDILGRQESPAEVRQILNAALKATQVEGRQLPLTEYLKLAKYAKSAGAALSPEFLGGTAPSFLQEEGGQRTGTALGSTVSQLIAGRSTKKAKIAQGQAGILGKNGKIVDPKLLMQNPDEWAYKHLGPAMQKKGFDPYASGNEAEVTTFMSEILSNQMVAGLFTKFFTQADQIKRNKEKLYPAAMGLDAAEKAPGVDPFVAWKGVVEQFQNFAAILGEAGVTNAIITGLNGISGAISSLNQALAGNSNLASLTANLLGVAAALLAIRTAVAGWALLKAFMPGAAAAGGAAAGAGAAGAAAGAAGAGAAAAGTAARGAAGFSRFIPGIGWVALGADTAFRLYNGEGKVNENDAADRDEMWSRIARRKGLRPAPTVSKAFGVGGALGEGTGSVGSGINSFGFGPNGVSTKVDTSDLDRATEKAKETKESLFELSSPVKASVDSSDLEKALGLARALKAELAGIGASINAAASAVQNKVTQQTRTAMRSLYSDYGTQETG